MILRFPPVKKGATVSFHAFTRSANSFSQDFRNFAADMVLNYIWIAFFVIAFLFAGVQLCMGDVTIFQRIVDSTFDTSKTAFETSLGLTGVLAL